MNARCLVRPVLAVLTIGALATSSLTEAASAATTSNIDPRQIAITASDLPPGFNLRPDYTRLTEFPNGNGVKFTILLVRPETEENLAKAPVAVSQAIIRIDSPSVSPEASLEMDRNNLLNQGWQRLDSGLNDYTHLSLAKLENGNVTYAYGTVRGNVEIATFVAGRASVVKLDHAVSVTELSVARYDQVVAGTI
ncbi:MAG: hypothetical protein IT307_07730 [Chloroflexi bacterium]|nr:hypothetical protein [Chloroflexota bacterium]